MTRDEEFKAIQLSVNDQEYKDVAKAVLSTAQTTVNEIVKVRKNTVSSVVNNECTYIYRHHSHSTIFAQNSACSLSILSYV